MYKKLVIGIVVALSAATAVSPPAHATVRKAVYPASSAGKIAIFGPDWNLPVRSDAAWDDVARNFDVLIGQREQYGDRLAHLHSVNPKVSILAYNNGPYLKKDSPQFTNTMRDHPDYFARDVNDNLITVKAFPTNYLMDQGNAGYRSQAADAIADLMQNYPDYDGVDVDSMGTGAINTSYVTAVPKNSATGHPYTGAEWLQTSVLSLNAIKDAITARLGVPRYVLFNGLINGPQYASSSKVLVTSKADGAVAEQFVRLAVQPATKWPTGADWLKELQMVIGVQAKGKAFFGWTKVWTTSTTQQQADWQRFALATYLLGKANKAYFDFLPTTNSDRVLIDPSWRANLGTALESYKVSNGVYSRRFQHGTVTVTPATHTASITTTA
jgi:hypothetical protein